MHSVEAGIMEPSESTSAVMLGVQSVEVEGPEGVAEGGLMKVEQDTRPSEEVSRDDGGVEGAHSNEGTSTWVSSHWEEMKNENARLLHEIVALSQAAEGPSVRNEQLRNDNERLQSEIASLSKELKASAARAVVTVVTAAKEMQTDDPEMDVQISDQSSAVFIESVHENDPRLAEFDATLQELQSKNDELLNFNQHLLQELDAADEALSTAYDLLQSKNNEFEASKESVSFAPDVSVTEGSVGVESTSPSNVVDPMVNLPSETNPDQATPAAAVEAPSLSSYQNASTTSLQERIEYLEKLTAELDDIIGKNEDAMESLKQENDSMLKRLEAADKNNEIADQEKRALESTLKEQLTLLKDQEQSIESLEVENKSLHAVIEVFQPQLQEMQKGSEAAGYVDPTDSWPLSIDKIPSISKYFHDNIHAQEKGQLFTLQKDFSKSQKALGESKSKINVLLRNESVLKVTVALLQKQNEALKRELEELEEPLQSAQSLLKSRNDELSYVLTPRGNNQHIQLASEIATLHEEKNSIRNDLNRKTEELRAKMSEMHGLQERYTATKINYDVKVEDLENANREYKNSAEKLRMQVQNSEEVTKELQEKLTNELAAAKQECMDLTSTNEDLTASRHQLTELLNEEAKKAALLRDEITSTESKYTTLVSTLTDDIAREQAEVARLESVASEMKAQYDSQISLLAKKLTLERGTKFKLTESLRNVVKKYEENVKILNQFIRDPNSVKLFDGSLRSPSASPSPIVRQTTPVRVTSTESGVHVSKPVHRQQAPEPRVSVSKSTSALPTLSLSKSSLATAVAIKDSPRDSKVKKSPRGSAKPVIIRESLVTSPHPDEGGEPSACTLGPAQKERLSARLIDLENISPAGSKLSSPRSVKKLAGYFKSDSKPIIDRESLIASQRDRPNDNEATKGSTGIASSAVSENRNTSLKAVVPNAPVASAYSQRETSSMREITRVHKATPSVSLPSLSREGRITPKLSSTRPQSAIRSERPGGAIRSVRPGTAIDAVTSASSLPAEGDKSAIKRTSVSLENVNDVMASAVHPQLVSPTRRASTDQKEAKYPIPLVDVSVTSTSSMLNANKVGGAVSLSSPVQVFEEVDGMMKEQDLKTNSLSSEVHSTLEAFETEVNNFIESIPSSGGDQPVAFTALTGAIEEQIEKPTTAATIPSRKSYRASTATNAETVATDIAVVDQSRNQRGNVSFLLREFDALDDSLLEENFVDRPTDYHSTVADDSAHDQSASVGVANEVEGTVPVDTRPIQVEMSDMTA
jgi:DNA repair exonuclease SbcCD ATPase subunit